MRHAIVAGLLALVALPALAAPPYDVTATVSAPSSGGPVDSYTLILNGADVGPVNVGANSLPGLLTADGTYTFTVRATNAAGSALSAPVTLTVTALTPPGAPGVTIQVDCSPCVITGQ